MGRAPCCSKVGLHRGQCTAEEDLLLLNYIEANGEGHWTDLPKKAGLLRCGNSCRLRWMNYVRPNIKRGNITPDEEELIVRMHRLLGNRWSLIAGRLPGRTDNEIKNFWNTHIFKKLMRKGIDPRSHRPLSNKEDTKEEYADFVANEHYRTEVKDVESNHITVSKAHVHLPKANKYIAFPPTSSNLSLTSIGISDALDMPLGSFTEFNSTSSISINNKAEQDLFPCPSNDEENGNLSLSLIPHSFTSEPRQQLNDDDKCIPLSYSQVYEEYMKLLRQDYNPNYSIQDLIPDIAINNGEQAIGALSGRFSSIWDWLQEDEELLNQKNENAPDTLSVHK